MARSRLTWLSLVILVISAGLLWANDGPPSVIRNPELDGLKDNPAYRVVNLWPLAVLRSTLQAGPKNGLLIAFPDITPLQDGTQVTGESVYGEACYGPYPHAGAEAQYATQRLRNCADIAAGHGLLQLDALLWPALNSEGWTDSGLLTLSFRLFETRTGKDRDLGTYNTFLAFKKTEAGFAPASTVIEGPLLVNVTSDDPSRVGITFRTDRKTKAAVLLDGRRIDATTDGPRFVIGIDRLQPDSEYTYQIEAGDYVSAPIRFKTAPKAGTGDVTIAYAGDCRAGVGFGDVNAMGLNTRTAERVFNLAWQQHADLFIFGGDLANGYTASPADLLAQWHGFIQAATGFWRTRPVYVAMGNHDAALRQFDDDSRKGVRLDRWPYATESSEALFADTFVQPENGPKPRDVRRPEYAENVYSLRYGPVAVIAFNNNYWVSNRHDSFGGSPEGYIFDEQMDWIEQELARAQSDETVRFIVMFAQEPVFPNGGHMHDAMWWNGDNRVRAYSRDEQGGGLLPEAEGIIQMRNRLLRAVAGHSKVAVVFGSDEHAYHRILIDKRVPVGNLETDDKNGNDVICEAGEPCSPLSDLQHPAWYITSGGAGAPYYAMQDTPWNLFWRNANSPCPDTRPGGCFLFSTQEHMVRLKTMGEQISLAVLSLNGEVIDWVPDLMAVKN